MQDYPDVDRGPQLAAAYIAGCGVTFVFVAMRLCARFSIAGVGIDDWSMLITWLVFIPTTILVSIMSLSGGTRHLEYLSANPTHMQYVVKLNWIAQPLCIFCLGAGKLSIAFLILRLLNRASVWRRWSLYIAIVWTAINTILMIVFTFVQCEDPAALWNNDIKARTKCWNPKTQSSFSIYGAAIHALMDFFLALIPITLVWGLKTDIKKRIALCTLLGCGSLTGICAAVKASKLISLNARSDFTWETYSLFMWTGIEIILLIVCGSIPALKPIYGLCMGRRSTISPYYQRYTNGSTKNMQGPSRRSYIQHTDSDDAFALASVSVEPPAMAVVSRGRESSERRSEDEIGRAVCDNIVEAAIGCLSDPWPVSSIAPVKETPTLAASQEEDEGPGDDLTPPEFENGDAPEVDYRQGDPQLYVNSTMSENQTKEAIPQQPQNQSPFELPAFKLEELESDSNRERAPPQHQISRQHLSHALKQLDQGEPFELEKVPAGSNSILLKYFSHASDQHISEHINKDVNGVPAIFYVVETNDDQILRTWIEHGGDRVKKKD
ncbi:hypothetical protein BCR34DRAFT_596160 [Clohesyomyces aquaticus]|uniref:Rhodopsin domain-containing protein n=1 Tax=Clohesyomyces aquaticus TaxID=1231657 RepID=A0A1Y2A7Q2_9PLEO|nr:hypothetical protein BCR34DRAFT_596160 [Clohesyomyces aquaticus]